MQFFFYLNNLGFDCILLAVCPDNDCDNIILLIPNLDYQIVLLHL